MAPFEVTLLGSSSNPFVIRAKIALNIKSVAYEHYNTSGSTSYSLPMFFDPLKNKFPILIHQGKPICESQIIVEYIDEVWSSGPSILPSDPYDRAIARFWASYLDDKWFPLLKSISIDPSFEAGVNVKVIKEPPPSKACIDQLVEGVVAMEGLYHKCRREKGGGCFFGGDEIGYLDIAFGCFLMCLSSTEGFRRLKFIDETKTPALFEWAHKFSRHPAVKDVSIIDGLTLTALYKKWPQDYYPSYSPAAGGRGTSQTFHQTHQPQRMRLLPAPRPHVSGWNWEWLKH